MVEARVHYRPCVEHLIIIAFEWFAVFYEILCGVDLVVVMLTDNQLLLIIWTLRVDRSSAYHIR